MILRTKLAVVLASAFALAACRDAPPPPAPADPPKIKAFTASNNQINPGGTVTLSYEVEGAVELELIDDTGAFIPLTGDVTTGTATVSPLTTHFYVLRASGRGGRDSAFVQVAVGAPLKEVFLIAAPPVVNGGESTQLLWGAFRNQTAQITSSAGQTFPLTGDSGALTVTPELDTTYTLIADPGTGAAKISSAVQVRVKPVINTFNANPAAAHAGETITLGWTTVGASSLTITETTFGQLFQTSTAADVKSGSSAFVLPMMLPNGAPLQDGLPLQFELRVVGSTPDSVVIRRIAGYVGSAPTISSFTVAPFVTRGTSLRATWSTSDAAKVAIRVDGQTVFETLPSDVARVDNGSVSLPAPTSDSTYELVATNSLGISTTKTATTTVIEAPTIPTFTLPATLNAPGSVATATWTTQNATAVTIRSASGVTLHSAPTQATVASGTVDIALGQTTTLIIEAANAAGDTATKTLTTTIPGAGGYVFTDAGTSLADIPVFTHFDLSSLSIQSVSGVPTDGVVAGGSANFVDLLAETRATTLSFSGTSDAVTEVSAPVGFRFPFFGRSISRFFVQVDGVVGFTPQTPSSSDNVNLPASALGDALAPFWETLELGSTGKVQTFLEPGAYPRRFIIQWSNVQITGATGTSDLTFQVQLLESGAFRFVYGPMIGAGAAAEDATIGAQSTTNKWRSQVAGSNSNLAIIAQSSEVPWFTVSSPTGVFFASYPGPVRFPVVAVNGNGRVAFVESALKIFPKDSIRVSEALPVPAAAFATTGQWVELQNTTGQSLNVGGLILRSSGSAAGGFVLPDVDIAAGATLLLGQSTNTAETDEAPVQYVYSDVPLAAASDTVTLAVGNGSVSELRWTTAPAAATSVRATEPFAYVGDGTTTGTVPQSCSNTATFNSAMTSFGTPGIANKSCAKYRTAVISGAFEDISGTGTALFASKTSDDQTTTVALPDAGQLTYFGQQYPAITVSTNGWVRFAPTGSSSPSNRGYLNATASTNGMLAPLWDDLDFGAAANSNVYFKRVDASASAPVGYSIVQWTNFTYWTGNDVMNFQLKAFDNGVLEYHYATMTSGGAIDYAAAASATVWIEEPGAARGHIISFSDGTSVIQSNTAYRFTPVAP